MLALAIILAIFYGGLWGLPTLVLGTAIWAIKPTLFINTNFSAYILIFTILFSIPLAATFAGFFIDRFILYSKRGELLRRLSLILAGAVALSAQSSGNFIEAAYHAIYSSSLSEQLVSFTGQLNLILFCGAGSALVLLSVVILFELPIIWLAGATSAMHTPAEIIKGLRILTVILLLSITYNYIVSFFAHEFWPRSIW